MSLVLFRLNDFVTKFNDFVVIKWMLYPFGKKMLVCKEILVSEEKNCYHLKKLLCVKKPVLSIKLSLGNGLLQVGK